MRCAGLWRAFVSCPDVSHLVPADAREARDAQTADSTRILMVCGKLPSPIRSGLDLRTQAIAEALARTMAVAVVATGGAPSPRPPGMALWAAPEGEDRSSNADLAASALSTPDDPFATLVTPHITRHLLDQVRDFDPDVIVVSRVQQWPFVAALRDEFDGPIILDLDETALPLAESIGTLGSTTPGERLRLRFLQAVARYEARAVAEADAVWVSSELEAAIARAQHPASPQVHVVRNAVDARRYRAIAERPRSGAIFPGNFAYPPNVSAAMEIATRIAPELPEIDFHVLGSNVPDALRRLQSANLHVAGPVADMASAIASARLAVLPIRAGGGTRLKVLECMAARTPMVATPKAIEGLPLEEGVHCLVADSSAQFVEAIRWATANPDAIAEMTSRAHTLVAEQYSLDAVECDLTAALVER